MNLRWLLSRTTAAAVVLAYGVVAEDNGFTTAMGSVAFQQANALFHFYVSTRMFSFRARWQHNWFRSGLPAEEYCNFSGILCDSDGYVQELTLRGKGLRGTLELTNLTRLQVLQLTSNTIHGSLPAQELAALQDLRILNLGGNAFSGTIPDLSSLPLLERVLLYENFLTGSIPTSLCNATRLTDLQLSGNARMRGTLPACLAELSQLTSLKITNAGLTGTIPTALCSLSRLNPDTSNCDAIGCAAGYYRVYQTSQSNESLCEACGVPSNAVASTSCLWIGDDTPAPTVGPSPAPTPAASERPTSSPIPTAIEALKSSNAPSRFINASSPPTESPVAVSNVKSPSETRKRSTAIAAIVAFAIIAGFFVFILVTGARSRSHCQEKIELDSGDEETSLGDPFPTYEIITASQTARQQASPPARNSQELRSPTSLPFIRPRRSPRRKHVVSPPPGVTSAFSSPTKIVVTDLTRTPSPGKADQNLNDWSTLPAASEPTSPISPKSIQFNTPDAPRTRSSLKQPESEKRLIGAFGDTGIALKQVRFSETGDNIVTFSYDTTSDGENDSKADMSLSPTRGSFFWNQAKADPVLEKHSLSGQTKPDHDDADTFSNSNDSIYDVRRQVAQPRNCPVVGFFSCGGSGTVDLEVTHGKDDEENEDDSSECFPCNRSSKPLFRNEKSFLPPKIFEDDARSGSPSSAISNSSEDDIMTSLGVIHDEHANDDDNNIKLRSGPVMIRAELVHSARFVRTQQQQRALMDDECTLTSKESTLFSGDNGNEKFVTGPDQAEI